MPRPHSSASAAKAYPASRSAPLGRPFNIVLFISDEEAYHLRPAAGYSTPAREELMQRGTTFHNHYIGAAMCTPSRGVMFSGQPPQVNGVFDQMELGYVPSLKTDKPSMGTIFKELGYATAYFGKFELRRGIITPKTDINYTDALREYGFDTFSPDGDKVGSPDQGYDTDVYTCGDAIRWLRTNAHELNEKGQPWLLVVSFVSPHDIMYADVNQPGKDVQKSAGGHEADAAAGQRQFRHAVEISALAEPRPASWTARAGRGRSSSTTSAGRASSARSRSAPMRCGTAITTITST